MYLSLYLEIFIGNEDFSLDSTLVMFSVNDPSLVMDCINVSTIQDQNYEGNHPFQVSITGINPATLPVTTPSNVNVVITENDGIILVHEHIQGKPDFSTSYSDAEVFMVKATDTVSEGDGSIDVCLDPGVGGMMERTLTVLLNFTNGTAS